MTAKKTNAKPMGSPWSEADVATAARMWQALMVAPAQCGDKMKGRKIAICQAIGDAIGRTVPAVSGRYRDYGAGFAATRGAAGNPELLRLDHATELTRDALAQARARQSLCAALLNDPPPGYSALDRKLAELAS